MKKKLILKRLLGILIVAAGLGVWVITKMNIPGIIIGVIVILAGCVVVSSTTPEERAALESDGVTVNAPGGMTIEEIFAVLEGHNSPIGEPWLGRVTMVDSRCILWGPGWHDRYIYAYLSTDGTRLHFAWSANKHLVVGPEEILLERLRRYPADYKKHQDFNPVLYMRELAPAVETLLASHSPR
ncbi:MAG: hypothetical protein E7632_12315 [Ruminococcaceae bacterium]|nr:hypothetical protein [Oscillospiraceae bacterium]